MFEEEGNAGACLRDHGDSNVFEDLSARGPAEPDDGQQAAQVVAEKRHVSRIHCYCRTCTFKTCSLQIECSQKRIEPCFTRNCKKVLLHRASSCNIKAPPAQRAERSTMNVHKIVVNSALRGKVLVDMAVMHYHLPIWQTSDRRSATIG